MTTESLAPEGVITDEMREALSGAEIDAGETLGQALKAWASPDYPSAEDEKHAEAWARRALDRSLAAVYPLIRAAVLEEAAKKRPTLAWPEPAPPTKDVCSYDHIKAHGFTIEWKSWKDYPGYTVIKDAVSENFIGDYNTLDEAKEAVARALATQEG